MKTEHKIEMKYVQVDECQPNDWNAQIMNDPTFQRLKQEISENGFIVPMQVVQMESGRYRIIGGEHRWMAAKELGMAEVPVAILPGKRWKDTDLQKFVTVRLNVLSGELDPVKFGVLYTEMAEKYGADAIQGLMAFTDAKAFAKVLGGVKKNLKKVLPKEMHADLDKAAKEASTVQDLGNIIQMMFSKYGETVGQSFMVFTYGKQEHIYVAMSKATQQAMGKVLNYCRVTGADINSVMESVTQQWAKEATVRLDQAKPSESQEKEEVEDDSPEF